MKRYRYKVRTGKGAIMSGVLLAEHKGEALQVLKGEHDRILSLKEDWFSVKGTRAAFFRWRAGTALQGTGYPA